MIISKVSVCVHVCVRACAFVCACVSERVRVSKHSRVQTHMGAHARSTSPPPPRSSEQYLNAAAAFAVTPTAIGSLAHQDALASRASPNYMPQGRPWRLQPGRMAVFLVSFAVREKTSCNRARKRLTSWCRQRTPLGACTRGALHRSPLRWFGTV